MSYLRHILAGAGAFLITALLIFVMKTMIEAHKQEDNTQLVATANFVSEVEQSAEAESDPRPDLPEMDQDPVEEEVEPDVAEPEIEPIEEPVELEQAEPELDLANISPIEIPPVKETKKPEKKPTEKTEKKKVKKNKAKKAGARKANKAKFVNKILSRPRPAYPASARRKKIQGFVVVSYSVLPSGQVTNVRVVSAKPGGIFNSAVLSAVRRWRYAPQGAAKHGLRTTLRFKLR